MILQEFFRQNPKVALAFSGGVDSAYLLYAGINSGCDIHAYYVKSAFQPQFELDDALKLANELGAKMTILDLDVLSDSVIVQNPANRCYFCKKKIFGKIIEAAKADGYKVLLDGTNASDDAGDRPGMRALQELQVLSPLRECGITKPEVRRLSKEAGLFTWDKPAYACLATRIPTGVEITSENLSVTEYSEKTLSDMGFTDFRIRLSGNDAKIQVKEEQLEKLLLYNRREILEKLKPYYSSITVDLEVRS
ncbi:MAG: ATP-dependent sacrificial sulfur transferase LarE [Lachnospiraceae bacterium]|nr:ATP-dependent sacrificial sulfur transferase LarE [Lachnospiraceae bacterium]MEE1015030.1 ATP-dependent sacrificial sulfur transferase LarE [Lachnospiraceae bacterium]